jgi:hypothetical protein
MQQVISVRRAFFIYRQAACREQASFFELKIYRSSPSPKRPANHPMKTPKILLLAAVLLIAFGLVRTQAQIL